MKFSTNSITNEAVSRIKSFYEDDSSPSTPSSKGNSSLVSGTKMLTRKKYATHDVLSYLSPEDLECLYQGFKEEEKFYNKFNMYKNVSTPNGSKTKHFSRFSQASFNP